MPDFVEKTIGWEFLDEPLWRWAVFMVAMSFIAWGWKGTLDFMK